MRIVGVLLLGLFLSVLLAPSCIVIDFLIEQDRIARDLCVQRMVPEQVRTCHGQCWMMKRLNACEQRGKDLPAELRDLRLDEALIDGPVLRSLLPVVPVPVPSGAVSGLLEGHAPLIDPVPWC